jgi:hypothetical protein
MGQVLLIFMVVIIVCYVVAYVVDNYIIEPVFRGLSKTKETNERT